MLSNISNILPYIQIVVVILLILSILLQQTGVVAGLGGAFGGGGATIKSTRRGLEKTLLKVSIFLSTIFFINSILLLLVK